MAREIRRIGKHYFVQTPNCLFPIEPHFLFPGFQWMPSFLKVILIRHYNLGDAIRSESVKMRCVMQKEKSIMKHNYSIIGILAHPLSGQRRAVFQKLI